MEKVTHVVIDKLTESAFVRPLRMKYRQNGVDKIWDAMKSHSSVCIVIFNQSRQKLVLVKQLRPTLIMSALMNRGSSAGCLPLKLDVLDADVVKSAVTLECCAGLLDKPDMSPVEIAQLEVLEECGYKAPLSSFRLVQTFPSGCSTTGEVMSLFYVQVTDDMHVNPGGGNPDEGELIDVVEMSVAEVRAYLGQSHVNSPPFTMFALNWFLMHESSGDCQSTAI